MPKKVSLLLLITCLFFSSEQEKKNLIVKIDIVSMKWSLLTNVDISCYILLRYRQNSFDTTITDKDFLSAVDEQLAKIDSKGEKKRQDARICCLIYRADKSIDTLSFGKIKEMYLNRRMYPFDKKLFGLIAEKLPLSHQKSIEKYMFQD